MAFLFLCLYTVFLIFRPQDFVPFLHGAPLMLIFLVSATVLTLWRKDFGLYDVPTWSLAMLLVVMMVSSIANGWAGGTVKIALEFGPVAATYLIYSHELREPGRLARISQIILVCTLLMVFHGIGQTDDGVGWTGARAVEESRVTWVGIFNDPNDLGLMFLVAIPMAIMLARLAGNRPVAAFWYLVALLHVYGIYLTRSRGALLTLLLMALIMGYRNLGKAKLIMAMLFMAPLVIYLSSGFRAIDPTDESAVGRIDAWYTAIQLFRENPLLGVGMNAFTEYNDLTAHNSYLLILSELGLLGYLFWVLMIMSSGLLAWYAIHARFAPPPATIETNKSIFQRPAEKVPDTHALAIEGQMVLYALVGYLGAAFFLSRSYIVVPYMICGMAVAIYHRARREAEEVQELSGSTLTGILVALVPLSMIGLYLTVRFLL